MKKIFILAMGLLIFLPACGLGFFSAAPTPTTPSMTPSATATASLTATITPTFTASPVPTPTWARQGPDAVQVPIILYHRIDISPINSQYYVPPEKFEEEMKLLHDWGYQTITTELLIKAINEGAELPPRPIVISFDDGHLNNYTAAFPIMKKYGFTGILYIATNYLGAENYLNAEQIKEMIAAGWEVGSHSVSHSDLTLQEPQRQRYEVVESRKILEAELGAPVLTIAYPFGISDPGVIDYAHFAGYIGGMGLGFTHDQGSTNLYNMQRRDIKGTYDVKQFALFLPWQGDPVFLPTDTPTPTIKPSRTPIPTYTWVPTKTPLPSPSPAP